MSPVAALLLTVLASPPWVDFVTAADGSRDYLPDALTTKLHGAPGAHFAECSADDEAWLEHDLGGPAGKELVVASFRDGVAVFDADGRLLGRFFDDSLRCGNAAAIRSLAVVEAPYAPPAVLFVVRDDTGRGREVVDVARMIGFDGLKLKIVWQRRVKEGERLDGSRVKWDRKARRFR